MNQFVGLFLKRKTMVLLQGRIIICIFVEDEEKVDENYREYENESWFTDKSTH